MDVDCYRRGGIEGRCEEEGSSWSARASRRRGADNGAGRGFVFAAGESETLRLRGVHEASGGSPSMHGPHRTRAPEKLIYAQPAPCSDSPRLLGVVDEECLAGWGCAPASTRGMCLLCCLHQGWRPPSCRPLRGCLRQGRCACLRKHADWQRWIRERQGWPSDKMRTDHRRCCA
jgi:hypothetical protein